MYLNVLYYYISSKQYIYQSNVISMIRVSAIFLKRNTENIFFICFKYVSKVLSQIRQTKPPSSGHSGNNFKPLYNDEFLNIEIIYFCVLNFL